MINVIALFLALGLSVTAWFADNKRTVHTQKLEVEIPPILYIRNNEADTNDGLQVLNLENLIIGQTTYIVFCVVPRRNENVAEYSLQLAYTTNMNESINLYRVSSISASEQAPGSAAHYGGYYYTFNSADPLNVGGDVTLPADLGQTFYGTYQRYTEQIFTDFDEGSFILPTDIKNNLDSVNISEASFYVLEIYWEDGINLNNIDKKETDLLYVYVKATSMTGN